jgi:hypothetical protein
LLRNGNCYSFSLSCLPVFPSFSYNALTPASLIPEKAVASPPCRRSFPECQRKHTGIMTGKRPRADKPLTLEDIAAFRRVAKSNSYKWANGHRLPDAFFNSNPPGSPCFLPMVALEVFLTAQPLHRFFQYLSLSVDFPIPPTVDVPSWPRESGTVSSLILRIVTIGFRRGL